MVGEGRGKRGAGEGKVGEGRGEGGGGDGKWWGREGERCGRGGGKVGGRWERRGEKVGEGRGKSRHGHAFMEARELQLRPVQYCTCLPIRHMFLHVFLIKGIL
jgi:hypothetical protein